MVTNYKKSTINCRKKWRDEYYKDLELQLRFRDIAYIDVPTCEYLDPASQTYIDKSKEEHAKKRPKQQNQEEKEYTIDNHWLMFDYTTKMHMWLMKNGSQIK